MREQNKSGSVQRATTATPPEDNGAIEATTDAQAPAEERQEEHVESLRTGLEGLPSLGAVNVPVQAGTPLTAASNSLRAIASEESRLGGWEWLLRFGARSAIVVAVGAILLFLVGLAQRYDWVTADGFSIESGELTSQPSETSNGQRYICPMMCTPPSTAPGRCPVCAMELVEATGGEDDGDGISVTIQPSARRLIGIQTAMSKIGNANRTIHTIGLIDYDETRLATISAYVDGRLEEMFADYVGFTVNQGDDLALIYSPRLYSAQTEFVTSLASDSSTRFRIGDRDLSELARENLGELGMTDEQIEALQTTRKPRSRIRIKSPQTGTVIEKAAVEGDYVKTGQMIYRIADLSSVWLMLDLFPDDAAVVRFGQQVEAEIQSLPGEVFTGRIAFIDPTVNKRTRTVRVRVEMMNFDGKLRPGDLATARIAVPAIQTELVYDPALSAKYISPAHPQIIRDAPGICPLCGKQLIPTSQLGYAAEPPSEQRVVTVPRDAVLLTGDSGVIYVETEPGRFEIRHVTVGPMSENETVIIEGLAAGETVATHGNFLIDSQMQLAGNPSLLDPSQAPIYAAGPIELPERQPVVLSGEAAQAFDAAYGTYFAIQHALAADMTPSPVALNNLIDSLSSLEMLGEVPDDAQQELAKARRAAMRMDGSLEVARDVFRALSHGMLRAAVLARGPHTSRTLLHYYCPMVPGGGGDWMQPGGDLTNPYWGEEMLHCGELVHDMSLEVSAAHPSIARMPE